MRRTKAEAQQTRAAIIDAALESFDAHGISGSTLDQIAAAAGVTKGAIYHHFGSKRAILHEIREQVALPLLDEADTSLLKGSEGNPLDRVEAFLLSLLDALEKDPRKRRALAVMQFRCEYVGEMAGELATALKNSERLAEAFEAAYANAKKARLLAAGVSPQLAGLETQMFLAGMVRMWLLHKGRHRFRQHARDVIRCHVQLRRAVKPARSAM